MKCITEWIILNYSDLSFADAAVFYMILDIIIITTFTYLVVFSLNVPPVKSMHLPPVDTHLFAFDYWFKYFTYHGDTKHALRILLALNDKSIDHYKNCPYLLTDTG